MKNNPIDILKRDHRSVEALFEEYESLGETAEASKRKVVDQIIEELTIHTEMEETICYPRFKKVFNKESDKMIDEAYVEHAGAKRLLDHLESLDPADAEFDANVKVLMEQIKHHVKEEEGEVFPAVKKNMSEEELSLMGEEMIEFKNVRVGAM